MNEKVFVCPDCGRTFGRAQGLGIHRRTVHGIEGTSKESARRRGEEPGPLVADAVYQRPLDEEKLAAMEAGFDKGVVAIPVDTSDLFSDRLAEFLPHLAGEAFTRMLEGDDCLVEPFFVLYLDAQA